MTDHQNSSAATEDECDCFPWPGRCPYCGRDETGALINAPAQPALEPIAYQWRRHEGAEWHTEARPEDPQVQAHLETQEYEFRTLYALASQPSPAATVERPKCRLCGQEDGACICAHFRPRSSAATNGAEEAIRDWWYGPGRSFGMTSKEAAQGIIWHLAKCGMKIIRDEPQTVLDRDLIAEAICEPGYLGHFHGDAGQIKWQCQQVADRVIAVLATKSKGAA